MEIARSFEVRHHGNIRSETLHDHSDASAYRYAGGFSAFAMANRRLRDVAGLMVETPALLTT